jgi:hypothetical protein
MRTLGIPIALLLAACSFRTVAGGGEDAPPGTGDGPGAGDAPGGDGPGGDGPSSTARRKGITINHTLVSGDQAQFPVWIALDDTDLQARATLDGSDIYFTDAAGAALPYQIQRWVKSTGRLEAWVRTDLKDTGNTVIELRYGDASRATAPNPPMVFASSFAAVWHLDDPLDTSAVADATGQTPGAAGNGLGAADQVAAQLGGGIDFDGNQDRITFTNPYTGAAATGSHTFSAWVNQRATTSCDTIVTVGTNQTNQSRWFHAHHDIDGGGPANPGVYAGFYGNDWPDAIANIDNGGWVLLHWVFDSGTLQGRVYRDGAMVGSHQFNSGVDTQGTSGFLGYAPSGWGGCDLNGTLDEVRLATVARSGGWIATEHANQSSPQTFYTVGLEEPLP